MFEIMGVEASSQVCVAAAVVAAAAVVVVVVVVAARAQCDVLIRSLCQTKLGCMTRFPISLGGRVERREKTSSGPYR